MSILAGIAVIVLIVKALDKSLDDDLGGWLLSSFVFGVLAFVMLGLVISLPLGIYEEVTHDYRFLTWANNDVRYPIALLVVSWMIGMVKATRTRR